MIDGVKHLHAELKYVPLGEVEILDGREIEVYLLGSDQVVAPAVAEQGHNGIGESRRIEPSMRSWMGEYRIHARNTIQAVAHRESRPWRIPRTSVQRLAALRGCDHTELPIANNLVHNTPTVGQGLPLAERQCVQRGSNKPVGNVERGNSVVAGAAAGVPGL